LGIPHSAITPEKVENNTPKKEHVKEMLPLGCLPLWGREGVTLIAATENYRMTGKRGSQKSPFWTNLPAIIRRGDFPSFPNPDEKSIRVRPDL
jgi:hypothetical protein